MGSPSPVVVEGRGLHTGAWSRVTLCPAVGPVRLSVGAIETEIDRLSIAGTEWATTVEVGTERAVELGTERAVEVGQERATTVEVSADHIRVATVEHLLAALGGLGIREGLVFRVEGPECPLLDGGAAKWCELLAGMDLTPRSPPLRVVRDGVVQVGASRYEFRVAEGIDIHVHFETNDVRVTPEARWQGDPADFRARIAPARTFAFFDHIDRLALGGLARGVDPAAVILLAPDAIHCLAPYSPDEPARHKLLDLVGDSYLWGGPPLGRMRVLRPGHSANARALRQARTEGILARVS